VLFAADDTTLELGSGIALQRQPLLDLLRQRARTVQLEDHVRFLCAAGKGVRELTHAQSVTRDFLWVDSRAENLGLSNNLSQALIEQVQAGKAVPDLFNIAIAQITEVLDQSGLVTTLIDDLLALL
jgi:predicted HAD superfamily Cof-like phosphohydrolase